MNYEDMKDKETPIRRKRGRPKKVVEDEKNEEDVELKEGYKAMEEEHKQFAKLSAKAAAEVVPDWQRDIDEAIIEEKVEVKIPEVKKVVDNREKICRYYGTWIGLPGYLQLPGVGRIFPGREIELSEKLAQALKKSPKNWRIRTSYEYK